jgi:hypothetical protein
MAEKKIVAHMWLETTATKESPGAGWKREILRWPKSPFQLTDGVVGLLRMTS